MFEEEVSSSSGDEEELRPYITIKRKVAPKGNKLSIHPENGPKRTSKQKGKSPISLAFGSTNSQDAEVNTSEVSLITNSMGLPKSTSQEVSRSNELQMKIFFASTIHTECPKNSSHDNSSGVQ